MIDLNIRECRFKDIDIILNLQNEWAKEDINSDRIMEFYKKHGYKTWYVQMFR